MCKPLQFLPLPGVPVTSPGDIGTPECAGHKGSTVQVCWNPSSGSHPPWPVMGVGTGLQPPLPSSGQGCAGASQIDRGMQRAQELR